MDVPRLRLLAHNVRSLWNVGSFFRTCDAMGVERIYLSGYTGTPPRKEITKTAIGAEEIVQWEKVTDPADAVRELKTEGWRIVSLEITPASNDIRSLDSEQDVLLIVGHELTGVPDDLLALSDEVVRIPMLGKKESLNVAVAVGMALFHLRGQSPTGGPSHSTEPRTSTRRRSHRRPDSADR
ncbi:MAG: tRNA/rRNA methyltransferase SpoU [Candidatus Peregrinibacteria bacterium Greene0416_19]|nr:MAG: tRNA/rRNA methyltransferase SpoU [Candidatus Peregrinibacteria bacterium Greene0416_19]